MKAIVNQVTCNGNGHCTEVCSDIFKLVNGKSTVTVDTGAVPDNLQASCKKAADECPTKSITIE
jgi:ferredoxin